MLVFVTLIFAKKMQMHIRESSNRDISVTACGNVFRYDVINLSIPSEESGNENEQNKQQQTWRR